MTTKSKAQMRAMTNSHPVVDPASLPDELNRMPDAMFQSPYFLDACTILRAHFSDDPAVFVDGNTIVCYNPDNLDDRGYPDCYIAFDVEADAIYWQNGYLTWQVGKAPDFVLEIASKSTYHRDLTAKRELYERIGVKEYWRFDPSGGDFYGRPLAGERPVNGAFEEIAVGVNADGLESGSSDLLSLCIQDKRFLFYNPLTRSYLRNLDESNAARLDAEARIRELEEELLHLRQ